MQLILFNIQWMSFNIMLAIIPVLFGWFLVQTKSTFLKLIYGSIWLAFLPNTIYLLTDIAHFFHDWHLVPLVYKGLFIGEYLLLMFLGIVSFIFGLYPIEKFIQETRSKKKQQKREYLVYILNFLIGFGIVLGRIERINSWDIITNTSKVIYTSIHTITSLQLCLIAIWFGLVSNLIYFSLRNFILKN